MSNREDLVLTLRATLTLGVLALLLLAPHLLAGPDDKPKPPRTETARPVVVELFTSEGCSSCPPADELLSRLAREKPDGPAPVLLAFHVDYWDKLGWPDRFASAKATSRQGDLSNRLKVNTYTPMAVVNGQTALVGSQEHALRQAMKPPQGPGVALTASAVKGAEPDTRIITVDASAAPEGSGVLVCLVEDGLETAVARGENAGRKLKHDRVVRAFDSVAFKSPRSSVTLTVPKDVRTEHARFVAVLWDRAGQPLGSTSIDAK